MDDMMNMSFDDLRNEVSGGSVVGGSQRALGAWGHKRPHPVLESEGY